MKQYTYKELLQRVGEEIEIRTGNTNGKGILQTESQSIFTIIDRRYILISSPGWVSEEVNILKIGKEKLNRDYEFIKQCARDMVKIELNYTSRNYVTASDIEDAFDYGYSMEAELRKRIESNARRSVQGYDWDSINERINNKLEEAARF